MPVPAPAAERKPDACTSTFPDGVEVELRRGKPGGHWQMLVHQNDRLVRREDIPTPFIEHAKQIVESSYGAPDGWRNVEEVIDGAE